MAATPIEGPTLSHWQRKIALQKWAVLGGRFGKLATCYWVSAGYVPRFTPPEGSFVNFLAQMTNTVLRYRGGKSGATAQPAPRHELPSLVEILALLKFRRSCHTIYGGFRPG